MFGRTGTRTALFLLAMSAAASASAAPINLVTNGDFSSGNTGFSTAYTFSPNDNDGIPAGRYSIETAGTPWHPSFVATGDHTTGTGNMFVANGKETPDVVWETTVSGLDPDTNYFFEAFLMNLCCSTLTRSGPQLEFYANNVLLGLGSTETPGAWTGVSNIWNSLSSSSVTLQLRNASVVFDGNDFALDDVYLGKESQVNQAPVPEPASIILLGTGFFVVARRMRRR